ncbi:hypothetical protein Micbo1qcDRAFT_173967 [Microdochium bolleyi]|uniref:Uncharacterized protein n=1 Tax=Microdochium bolleyi TaxID=196109 RepID=A0A136J727_9PEZI|nr:hypothetical protein Micbo1qcDRAFT_173967 [Microdochium bolleyi]
MALARAVLTHKVSLCLKDCAPNRWRLGPASAAMLYRVSGHRTRQDSQEVPRSPTDDRRGARRGIRRRRLGLTAQFGRNQAWEYRDSQIVASQLSATIHHQCQRTLSVPCRRRDALAPAGVPLAVRAPLLQQKCRMQQREKKAQAPATASESNQLTTASSSDDEGLSGETIASLETTLLRTLAPGTPYAVALKAWLVLASPHILEERGLRQYRAGRSANMLPVVSQQEHTRGAPFVSITLPTAATSNLVSHFYAVIMRAHPSASEDADVVLDVLLMTTTTFRRQYPSLQELELAV